MLHEILLSLSGHASPLLTSKTTEGSQSISVLSPPEKSLISSLTHLSDLHRELLDDTAKISATHPSSICQAVATSIQSTHLVRFQQKILEVESNILRKDAGSVGAYNIVPLTAIVGEFSEWMRRMEWFKEVVTFIKQEHGSHGPVEYCTGARIIDELCRALQTGYTDIEEVASSLVRVAETAWLKQLSTWILYGGLPTFGGSDFLVQLDSEEEKAFSVRKSFLPAFVTPNTAMSILFIGQSLNHIRSKGIAAADGVGMSTSPELALLPTHLRRLSSLPFPLSAANLSNAISEIRISLSQTTLQRLLPTSKIMEMLSLLRDFFLLGRGEFALALVQEADDKIRSRWRRADNLGYEKRDGLGNVVVKEGEVSAVLARTWAAMSLYQGLADADDEQLEMARDLIQLVVTKSTPVTPARSVLSSSAAAVTPIVETPFKDLLLSVPVDLKLQIRSPIDLFLAPSDMQVYSSINAYLLSIRRAHLRLSDLWKVTTLRRDHPAPPQPPYGSSRHGKMVTQVQRIRAKERSLVMRSVWATGSAALFFLAETEAYLQGEVVKGTWEGLQAWLNGTMVRPTSPKGRRQAGDDFWMSAAELPSIASPSAKIGSKSNSHDPQTLADAHRRYLSALTTNLLLTNSSFTEPLHYVLLQIDHLISLVHRLHTIWQSLDLETDQGVVDAFSDFAKEQYDVQAQLKLVTDHVKYGIEGVITSLRQIDQNVGMEDTGYSIEDESAYVPKKVGGVDRLLMKMDFGTWFERPVAAADPPVEVSEEEL